MYLHQQQTTVTKTKTKTMAVFHYYVILPHGPLSNGEIEYIGTIMPTKASWIGRVSESRNNTGDPIAETFKVKIAQTLLSVKFAKCETHVDQINLHENKVVNKLIYGNIGYFNNKIKIFISRFLPSNLQLICADNVICVYGKIMMQTSRYIHI